MNDELEKLKGDKSLPLSEILKRTFKYIKPEMLSFIIALVLLGVNTFLDILKITEFIFYEQPSPKLYNCIQLEGLPK